MPRLLLRAESHKTPVNTQLNGVSGQAYDLGVLDFTMVYKHRTEITA